MYIHTTSMLQPKNNILNIGSINRSIQHQTNPISKKANQDRISISPQGKMMQMIDQLNKQKESIIQHKNEFINQSTENGIDAEMIKAMTDVYEQQIKDIDKQISDLYAQQTQETTKQNEQEKPKQKYSTKEEAQMQKMHNIANIANEVEKIEQISALQVQTENEIHIKQSQIDINALRIDNLESKKAIDPNANVVDLINNERHTIANKQQDIADLKTKISDLTQTYGNLLQQTTEQLDNENNTEQKEQTHLDDTETTMESLSSSTFLCHI